MSMQLSVFFCGKLCMVCLLILAMSVHPCAACLLVFAVPERVCADMPACVCHDRAAVCSMSARVCCVCAGVCSLVVFLGCAPVCCVSACDCQVCAVMSVCLLVFAFFAHLCAEVCIMDEFQSLKGVCREHSTLRKPQSLCKLVSMSACVCRGYRFT